MLEKCVLPVLELNSNQRLGHKKTKLNSCHHMLALSTQLQNRSFDVVERTRTSPKCQKNEKCTCKACKNTVFLGQICKFVRFLLPSSSWLLKLPSGNFTSLLRQKAYSSACRTIIPHSTNRNIINLRRWHCPRRGLSSQWNQLESE